MSTLNRKKYGSPLRKRALAAKADLDASISHLDSINAMTRGLKKDIHELRARAARGEAI